MIFRSERSCFTKCRTKFIHDMSLLQCRIKDKHRDSFLSRLKSLP
jgi:hypothetical protein